MSRSKRKKKTRLCVCGMRVETSDRGAHDICRPNKKAKELKFKRAKEEG